MRKRYIFLIIIVISLIIFVPSMYAFKFSFEDFWEWGSMFFMLRSGDIWEGNESFETTGTGTLYDGNFTYNNGTCIITIGPSSILEVC